MACFQMPYVIALRTVMKDAISSAVAEQDVQLHCMCKIGSSLTDKHGFAGPETSYRVSPWLDWM